MEVPIGNTRFKQFSVGQKVVLILNNFEPVEAIVTNSHESKTTPLNTITLRVNTSTLQMNEKFWNHPYGIEIREEEGSIATTLPTQPLINKTVSLNYDKTGQYVSTHSQIVGGISSIIFSTSGRSGGAMPTGGGKSRSRKYYKKLSKKYRKNRKTRKLRKNKNKNKNKYSK